MASLNPYQSPASAANSPAEPIAKELRYRSLDLLTRLVQGQCLLLAALSLGTALAAAQAQQTAAEMQQLLRKAQNQNWQRAEANNSVKRYEALEAQLKGQIHVLQLLSGPFVLLLALVLLATVVFWVYRAAANLPALAAHDSRQSPWVAALSMAIPLVNVLAAIGVMGQIAKGSDPNGYSVRGRAEGSSQIVVWWWVTNVVSVAGGIYASAILAPAITSPAELEYYLRILTAVSGYSIVPLGLAAVMFGVIAANQDKRRDKVLAPPPTKRAAGTMDFLSQLPRE